MYAIRSYYGQPLDLHRAESTTTGVRSHVAAQVVGTHDGAHDDHDVGAELVARAAAGKFDGAAEQLRGCP